LYHAKNDNRYLENITSSGGAV